MKKTALTIVSFLFLNTHSWAHRSQTDGHEYYIEILNATSYEVKFNYSNTDVFIMLGSSDRAWIHTDGMTGSSAQDGSVTVPKSPCKPYDNNGWTQEPCNSAQYKLHAHAWTYDQYGCDDEVHNCPVPGKWELDAYISGTETRLGHLAFYTDQYAHMFIDDVDHQYKGPDDQQYRFYLCWSNNSSDGAPYSFHREKGVQLNESGPVMQIIISPVNHHLACNPISMDRFKK